MVCHIKNVGLKFKCDNFLYNRHQRVLKNIKNSKIDGVVYGGIQWWGLKIL
jgi:hypothetical protein